MAEFKECYFDSLKVVEIKYFLEIFNDETKIRKLRLEEILEMNHHLIQGKQKQKVKMISLSLTWVNFLKTAKTFLCCFIFWTIFFLKTISLTTKSFTFVLSPLGKLQTRHLVSYEFMDFKLFLIFAFTFIGCP